MIYPGDMDSLKDPIVNRDSYHIIRMLICIEHYHQYFLIADITNQRLRFSQTQC